MKSEEERSPSEPLNYEISGLIFQRFQRLSTDFAFSFSFSPPRERFKLSVVSSCIRSPVGARNLFYFAFFGNETGFAVREDRANCYRWKRNENRRNVKNTVTWKRTPWGQNRGTFRKLLNSFASLEGNWSVVLEAVSMEWKTTECSCYVCFRLTASPIKKSDCSGEAALVSTRGASTGKLN